MTSRHGRVQCDSRDDDDDDNDDNAKLKMRLEANGYERKRERNEAGVGFRAWASIHGPAMWKTMPGIRVNALFMRHFIDEDDGGGLPRDAYTVPSHLYRIGVHLLSMHSSNFCISERYFKSDKMLH